MSKRTVTDVFGSHTATGRNGWFLTNISGCTHVLCHRSTITKSNTEFNASGTSSAAIAA
jgi:hypothetical protein